MPQRRTAGFRIHPIAWRHWESVNFPHRLDEVVEMLFQLDDRLVRLNQLQGPFSLWTLDAVLEGTPLRLFGARDPMGAWYSVLVVLTLPPAVGWAL